MGTLAWFGERWDAPAFEDAPEIPVPAGEPCLGCEEEIALDDSGITMPYVSSTEEASRGAYHIECYLRSILGSVAHLEKRCSCYGGTDSEGYSREESRAVMDWLRKERTG